MAGGGGGGGLRRGLQCLKRAHIGQHHQLNTRQDADVDLKGHVLLLILFHVLRTACVAKRFMQMCIMCGYCCESLFLPKKIVDV